MLIIQGAWFDVYEIRKLGFYYIDKTRLIEQLLQGWGKVTLLPALAVLVRLSI